MSSLEPAVHVESLRKVFFVRERTGGLGAAVRQLFHAPVREVVAVDDVSFEIARGERVAFVGPNGAGKSTTIKMLSGILHPTSGRVRVCGLDPATDRRSLGYRIGTVFGQRSQLWYHLPATDTFDLLARVYDLDDATYQKRRAMFVEAFELGELLAKPVRQLSLGERMRCEVVASLLHAPDVVFLDEPTIGLDVTAKAVIRDLVRDTAAVDGRSVMLTSHDTGDMESVCDRVIVIHRGKILLDRPVAALRRSYIRRKRVTLRTAEERIDIVLRGVEVVERAPHLTRLEVDVEQISMQAVVQAAIAASELHDLSVEDPPMEEIIQAIYRGDAPTRPEDAAS